MDIGQRSKSLQIYNCRYNWVDVFDDVLPQNVSCQKIWGPSFTDMGMAVLSSVIGQN